MLLRDKIYQLIRYAILSGEFRPGQELREQVLADQYRSSRSPVRDSLLRLEQERLITVLPRQGYRVNPIVASDVDDIYRFRMLIEPACAAGAARRDDAAVRTLDRFRDYTDDSDGRQAFLDHNRSFHIAVADMAGNARMAAVAHDLVEHVERLSRFCLPDNRVMEMTGQVRREHEAIIDAIQAHDPNLASRLAYQHVDGGRERVIGGQQWCVAGSVI